jgi:hypothetical protein
VHHLCPAEATTSNTVSRLVSLHPLLHKNRRPVRASPSRHKRLVVCDISEDVTETQPRLQPRGPDPPHHLALSYEPLVVQHFGSRSASTWVSIRELIVDDGIQITPSVFVSRRRNHRPYSSQPLPQMGSECLASNISRPRTPRTCRENWIVCVTGDT